MRLNLDKTDFLATLELAVQTQLSDYRLAQGQPLDAQSETLDSEALTMLVEGKEPEPYDGPLSLDDILANTHLAASADPSFVPFPSDSQPNLENSYSEFDLQPEHPAGSPPASTLDESPLPYAGYNMDIDIEEPEDLDEPEDSEESEDEYNMDMDSEDPDSDDSEESEDFFDMGSDSEDSETEELEEAELPAIPVSQSKPISAPQPPASIEEDDEIIMNFEDEDDDLLDLEEDEDSSFNMSLFSEEDELEEQAESLAPPVVQPAAPPVAPPVAPPPRGVAPAPTPPSVPNRPVSHSPTDNTRVSVNFSPGMRLDEFLRLNPSIRAESEVLQYFSTDEVARAIKFNNVNRKKGRFIL